MEASISILIQCRSSQGKAHPVLIVFPILKLLSKQTSLARCETYRSKGINIFNNKTFTIIWPRCNCWITLINHMIRLCVLTVMEEKHHRKPSWLKSKSFQTYPATMQSERKLNRCTDNWLLYNTHLIRTCSISVVSSLYYSLLLLLMMILIASAVVFLSIVLFFL